MDNLSASAPAERLPGCLVVEDDPIIRLDLEETLKGFGCVMGAATLEAAAGIASAGGIGFAILDYELGQHNTMSLAESLIAQGVAVIFLSAHRAIDLPPLLQHANVIAKPFTSAIMRDAVISALKTAEQPGAKGLSCLCRTG